MGAALMSTANQISQWRSTNRDCCYAVRSLGKISGGVVKGTCSGASSVVVSQIDR